MAKQKFKNLISQINSNEQEKVIQKVVPVPEHNKNATKEVQFLFRIDPKLLKKIKLKALEEETSVKQLLIKAIKEMQ